MITYCPGCDQHVSSGLAKGGEVCRDCLLKDVSVTISDLIRSDTDNRAGIHIDYDVYEEFIREDWVNIIKEQLRRL